MNASTYLKLASAARDFAKQDDAWQAMYADETIKRRFHLALQTMPEVLAESAILVLGVARCAVAGALSNEEE